MLKDNKLRQILGSEVKEKIVKVLSSIYPLNAKSIHNRLVEDYNLKISYQAVHKALKELVANNYLVQNKLEYKININFIEDLNKFSVKLRDKYIKRRSSKHKIKVICFDLDGSLSDEGFDEMLWRTEIPQIYAKENNISFEEAYKKVTSEYKRLWGKVLGWRDPEFWFEHFKFKTKWNHVLNDMRIMMRHHGDVIPVLKELKQKYKLVLLTHADRKLMDLKLKLNDLEKYFDKTYSTISDFKEYNKSAEVYLKVCKLFNISPNEMIHIGDDKEFDYLIPSSVGIRSYWIDRKGRRKEKHVVRHLFEFIEKLEE